MAPDHGPGRFPVLVRRSRGWQGWGIPDVDGGGVKVGVSGPASPKRRLSRPEANRAAAPVVCGGLAEHGFEHAAAVGLAAARPALEAATELPVRAFSPDRVGARE
ncbi:hypothetical protein [Streptomyces sp. NPDC002467]|uniref:hypothetical protein n=1 Tax=Streptomyces sp. NPDC002467 TaxID=3364647 RepID=UPI0036C68884